MKLFDLFLITFACIQFSESNEDENCVEEMDFSFLESDHQTGEHWIDPYDMFNYEPGSTLKDREGKIANKQVHHQLETQHDTQLQNDIKESSNNQVSCKCKNVSACLMEVKSLRAKIDQMSLAMSSCNELLYLKRILNKIINKFDSVQQDEVTVRLTVLAHDIKIVKNYHTSPCKYIQELDNVLSKIINSGNIVNDDEINSFNILSMEPEKIIITIIICFTVIIIWFLTVQLTVKKIIFIVSMLLFLLNVGWQWIYLVKKEYANLYAEMNKSVPPQCRPENLSLIAKVSLWIGSGFASFDSTCKEYYENIHISPMLKVSPFVAIWDTLSQLLFRPLGLFGNHCGMFFANLYQNLSWFQLIIVSIIFTIIMLVLLFIVFQYKIHLPFFFGMIEPTNPPPNTRPAYYDTLIDSLLEGRIQILRNDSLQTIINSVNQNSHLENNNKLGIGAFGDNATIAKTTVSKTTQTLPAGVEQNELNLKTGLCERQEQQIT